MPASIENTENKQVLTNSINAVGSGIVFHDNLQKDPNGSQLPEDKSYTQWQNAYKTFIKLANGDVGITATNDIMLNAAGDIHVTAHNKQETTSGGSAVFNKGAKTNINGENNADQKALIKQHHVILDQIDLASDTAMKSAQAEKVLCPNCAQQLLVDDKSDNWSVILDEVSKLIEGIPYMQGPFAVLRFLISKVYVATLGVVSNIGLNGGKGCGPGCNSGMKDGLANKLSAGQQAATDKIQETSDQMNQINQQLSPNSSTVNVTQHSETFIYGDPESTKRTVNPYKDLGTYHSKPHNLRTSSTHPNKLRVTTEGNCKQIVYNPPQPSEYGNLTQIVANKYMLSTGVCGADIISSGEIAVKGGSVHINGSQGEVSLTSSNLTTVAGANVVISADNKSGDTGVLIDSKYTYVRGAFNVNGDTAMLGSLTIDGALSVPFINCPSMAAPSTLTGPDNFSTHHGNWSYMGNALNTSNLLFKLGLKYALQPSLMMTVYGITDIFMEAYNAIVMNIPIEHIPTGIFMGIGLGVSTGIIFNFPHNHTRPPDDHGHQTAVPNARMTKTQAGAGLARVAGNPAPTPAPTSGTFPRPGPKTEAGGCGGGGLFVKARNQAYGIDSEDAFNGGNFVTTTVVRNFDGSILPPPDLTYRKNNDNGNVTIDPITGLPTPVVTTPPIYTTTVDSDC
jgi:hypothetical protein